MVNNELCLYILLLLVSVTNGLIIGLLKTKLKHILEGFLEMLRNIMVRSPNRDVTFHRGGTGSKIGKISVTEFVHGPGSILNSEKLKSGFIIFGIFAPQIWSTVIELTPPEVQQSPNKASFSLLPERSSTLYQKTYQEFEMWCEQKGITHHSESVLLEYFYDLVNRGLIPSLWPKYSMLKATLILEKNIDISKYSKLIPFIKKYYEGHVPKKSKILTKEEITKFISDAPNETFLMSKVALIFGLAGALRKNELLTLLTDDVQDLKTKFLVTVRSTRTKTTKVFRIVENEENTFLKLIRHYISLRPAYTPHKLFFVNFGNNRCSTQPIDINTVCKMPSGIAQFLKLDQPHLYTGSCFLRSAPSILSDAGSDFAAIRRGTGRKSTAVAKSYIEDSIEDKVDIENKVDTEKNMFPYDHDHTNTASCSECLAMFKKIMC